MTTQPEFYHMPFHLSELPVVPAIEPEVCQIFGVLS